MLQILDGKQMKVVGYTDEVKSAMKYILNGEEGKIVGSTSEILDFAIDCGDKHGDNFKAGKVFGVYVPKPILEPLDSILERRGNKQKEESGKHFWIFNKKASDEEIMDYLVENNVELEGVRVRSAYDCTGRYFSGPIEIKRGRKWTLVKQSFGYDV